MMLNVDAFFFCVFLPFLMSTFDTSSANAVRHPHHERQPGSLRIPEVMLSSSDLEDIPELECKNGGYRNDEQNCVCKAGFVGEKCEKAEVLRCEVSKATTNCPVGQWCAADNFFCYFRKCRKPLGWCLPNSFN